MDTDKPEDSRDLETAEWLRSEFKNVTYDLEMPAEQVKVRNKRQISFALAASIAAVAVVVSAVALPEPAPVWAAEPIKLSVSEEADMVSVCSKAISRGLGAPEGSGTASPDDPNTSNDKIDGAIPPTTLPPLIAIDRRGTGAVALFEDKNWQVTCPLRLSGNTWKDQGLSVQELNGSKNPGATALFQTVWADGSSITVESGLLADPNTCAAYKLATGEKAKATCNAGRYLIWYPDSVKLDRTTKSFTN